MNLESMGRRSKKAEKVRKGLEFDLTRLARKLEAPTPIDSAHAWTLEQIRLARDNQLVGIFQQPVRMAAAMRTDDALFTAWRNRLAPQSAISVKLKPANDSPAALRIANEAEGLFGPEGIGVTADTLAGINGTLANHGVAVGIVTATPREDGSRVDFSMVEWPLEWVRWDPLRRCLVTQVDPEQDESTIKAEERVSKALAAAATHPFAQAVFRTEIPIVHGDGRWVIFQKHAEKPWQQEACVLPAAMVWARHAFAARDWTKGSKAHGDAKVIGELPEGIALADEEGNASPEAAAYLKLLQALIGSDAPVGIAPAGSKTQFIANTSTAWQVWQELMLDAKKSAARIYLGTDGTLGAQGGAPGVDISALFGVATTIVQGDLGCIERALLTGLIEPWCATNFTDSRLVPRRVYLIPDPDADRKHEAHAKRAAAFHAEIDAYKKAGFVLDQDTVNRIAAANGIDAPILAPAAEAKVPLEFAPTQRSTFVRVREARAADGLPPFGDERDEMTLFQLEEKLKSDSEARKIAAEAVANPPQPQPSMQTRSDVNMPAHDPDAALPIIQEGLRILSGHPVIVAMGEGENVPLD